MTRLCREFGVLRQLTLPQNFLHRRMHDLASLHVETVLQVGIIRQRIGNTFHGHPQHKR